MAVIITKENYKQEIEQASQPVVIDVFATWCGPCQQMLPIFQELEAEHGNKFKFAKLNVDEAREIAIQFGVTSIPTFIFLKGGVMQGKETGYMHKEDLLEKIELLLG